MSKTKTKTTTKATVTPTKAKKEEEKLIRNELTREQKGEIEDAFQYFKEDGINPEDFYRALRILGIDETTEENQRILSEIKKMGNKPINFDKYLEIMIEKPSGNPAIEMSKAFKLFCMRGEDIITPEGLRAICDDLGEKVTDEEIDEMIEEADKNKDGRVTEDDFIQILKKTNMF